MVYLIWILVVTPLGSKPIYEPHFFKSESECVAESKKVLPHTSKAVCQSGVWSENWGPLNEKEKARDPH